MPDASSGDETVTVTVEVNQSVLDEIDEAWQERGFGNRSEYVRHVLRDAAEFPTFDRSELVALLQAERDVREARSMGAEAARDRFGEEDWGDWEETAVDPRTVRDRGNDG